jgi:hypothetical protein
MILYVVLFDSRGLQAYLEHPAYRDLGARFNACAANALVYDYEMIDGRSDPGVFPNA